MSDDLDGVRWDLETLFQQAAEADEERGQLEQYMRELEARLEATSRVLFRLVSYNQCFREALLDHLYGKKVSRKELLDRANSMEEHHRSKEQYYDGLKMAIKAEMEVEDDAI